MKAILASAAIVWFIAYMYMYEMDMWHVYHGKPKYIIGATVVAAIYIAIASIVRQAITQNKTKDHGDE